jgi:hypothetical protein
MGCHWGYCAFAGRSPGFGSRCRAAVRLRHPRHGLPSADRPVGWCGRSVGWCGRSDWSAGRPIGRFIDWPIGRFIGRFIGWSAGCRRLFGLATSRFSDARLLCRCRLAKAVRAGDRRDPGGHPSDPADSPVDHRTLPGAHPHPVPVVPDGQRAEDRAGSELVPLRRCRGGDGHRGLRTSDTRARHAFRAPSGAATRSRPARPAGSMAMHRHRDRLTPCRRRARAGRRFRRASSLTTGNTAHNDP